VLAMASLRMQIMRGKCHTKWRALRAQSLGQEVGLTAAPITQMTSTPGCPPAT